MIKKQIAVDVFQNNKEADTKGIYDYMCENRLRKLSPELHKRFSESVIVLEEMLNKYKMIFPDFTDHTILHSMDVLNFCNQIIGENIEKLNADELYVLMMSCYLHDIGMGISQSDYEDFSKRIDFGNYFETHDKENVMECIRDFHNEYSGHYIQKYADIFDIPDEKYVFAIIQVSRGHRRTDLFDEKEYPTELEFNDGNTVCLPYLASLIRLADEIDVTADRNLKFLFDPSRISNEISRIEFQKHRAIKELVIEEDSFIMQTDASNEFIFTRIQELRKKMQDTLDYCNKVVDELTMFTITQREIVLEKI